MSNTDYRLHNRCIMYPTRLRAWNYNLLHQSFFFLLNSTFLHTVMAFSHLPTNGYLLLYALDYQNIIVICKHSRHAKACTHIPLSLSDNYI